MIQLQLLVKALLHLQDSVHNVCSLLSRHPASDVVLGTVSESSSSQRSHTSSHQVPNWCVTQPLYCTVLLTKLNKPGSPWFLEDTWYLLKFPIWPPCKSSSFYLQRYNDSNEIFRTSEKLRSPGCLFILLILLLLLQVCFEFMSTSYTSKTHTQLENNMDLLSWK